MKANFLSTSQSVLFISIIEFLERFSYYGMRAVAILYAIDTVSGLNLERNEALSIYGYFAVAVAVLPLICGIFSDFIFKQKNAVVVGGITSLFGYLLLLHSAYFSFIIGLGLIAVGSSFVRPNLAVLLGRQFHKSDRKRDIGFIVYYSSINLAAFLSIISVGYLGEIYGWKYGFILTAISTFLYLLFFVLIKNTLGKKEITSNTIYKTSHSQILDDDFEIPSKIEEPKRNNSSIIPVLLVSFLTMLFWAFYEIGVGEYFEIQYQREDLEFMGQFVPKSTFQSLGSFILLPLMAIFGIVWYIRGSGSTIKKFAYAFCLLFVAILIFSQANSIPDDQFVLYSIVAFSIVSFAEIFISPIALSYITRVSDTNFASTYIGLFFFLSYFGGKILGFFSGLLGISEMIYIAIGVSLIIGISLLAFRKTFISISNGID